jgi:hypothetical protein
VRNCAPPADGVCASLPVTAHAGTAEFITDGVAGLLAADDKDMVDSETLYEGALDSTPTRVRSLR